MFIALKFCEIFFIRSSLMRIYAYLFVIERYFNIPVIENFLRSQHIFVVIFDICFLLKMLDLEIILNLYSRLLSVLHCIV
jgi:hypothetical protein